MSEKLICFEDCPFVEAGFRPCTSNVAHSHYGNGCEERIRRNVNPENPALVTLEASKGHAEQNVVNAYSSEDEKDHLVAKIYNGKISRFRPQS